jgi:hypothetical protein
MRKKGRMWNWGEPCVHPASLDSERKKRYFTLLLIFFFLALVLPTVEAEEYLMRKPTDEEEEYLLMKPIQDSLNTGNFNHLKNHSENRVSINCELPFKLDGYIYIEKFIDDFNRKFAQYETNKIQWVSRHMEEEFAVQSLILILKDKQSDKIVYYKFIFFLKKEKILVKTEEIKEWKIYYLRGLRI